jgi:mitochondrial fission protein ELM1
MSNQQAAFAVHSLPSENAADVPEGVEPNANEVGETPRIWALFGHNTGDNSQLKILADAIGWPYERKQLVWDDPVNERALALRNSNWRTAEPRFSRDKSSPLEPPWPDMVISADILCSWAAMWIRRQSGTVTKLVRMGNPRGPVHIFDLLISPPQFAVPPRPNVVHLPEPIVTLDQQRMADAAAAWGPRLQHLPRPWHALLVGGQIKQYPFDQPAGRLLVERIKGHLRREAGSLLVSTSRRTPPAIADLLEAELPAPRFLHRWAPDVTENPYLAYLGLADDIIVTADSATMLSEACSTRKPVYIYVPNEPFRRGMLKRRVIGMMAKIFGRSRPGSHRMNWMDRLHDHLHENNIIHYNRDLAHLHRTMLKSGAAAYLGHGLRPGRKKRPSMDAVIAEAAARVRGLLTQQQG